MADEWTIGRLLAWTADYLKQHGSDSPRLEADRYWADEMAALQAAVLGGSMSGGFLLGR